MLEYEFIEYLHKEKEDDPAAVLSMLDRICVGRPDARKESSPSCHPVSVFTFPGFTVKNEVDAAIGIMRTHISFLGARPGIVDHYLHIYSENNMTKYPRRA